MSARSAPPPIRARVSYPGRAGHRHFANVIVKDPREKIQAKWLRGSFYEAQRHGMLNCVYRRFRGGTFVDIGAAIGNHTLFFALCCAAKRVFSFEPVTPLYEHLLENVALNGLECVRTRNIALGARTATVGMKFRDLPVEQGGMLIGQIDETGGGTAMERLDDVLEAEALDEIECIKIDVEGYGLEVLEGAAETLRTFRPAVFCECDTQADFERVDGYLSTLGYRVWRTGKRPFVMNHTPTYLWEHDGEVDITIIVTTFNRPAELARVVHQLERDAAGLDVRCLVYDDCSELPYDDLPAGNPRFRVEYDRLPLRHGKAGYWQLMNRIFADLRRIRSRYYLQLPDDVLVKPGFLSHAVRTFEAIDDPDKICLNLYLDDSRIGRPNWTKRLPTIERFGETSVFRTGWVDMIFIGGRRFLQELGFELAPVPPSRWGRNPRLSSGVGQQITRRLNRFSMYQVRSCMLESTALPSRMNPERPPHEDLSVAELDPIVCGVASMPERVEHLRLAVTSVLPFVDELHVFLNGHGAVPGFLGHPKISVHRSQDHGDLGDAGKFFKAGERRAHYIAVDDDLVLPPDFVWRMVNEIRRNRRAGRRLALGLHGRVMADEVHHYYRGHRTLYHIGRAVEEAVPVHVLGTGAVAFHTDDLDITIDDLRGPANMADIHFSIACQKRDVGCVVLPHPPGYVTVQPVPSARTIWGRYRNDDAVQTRVFNSWRDWRLRA